MMPTEGVPIAVSLPPSKADETPDLDSYIDRFETAWRENAVKEIQIAPVK